MNYLIAAHLAVTLLPDPAGKFSMDIGVLRRAGASEDSWRSAEVRAAFEELAFQGQRCSLVGTFAVRAPNPEGPVVSTGAAAPLPVVSHQQPAHFLRRHKMWHRSCVII